MASEEELELLESAEDDNFDQLFVELMSEHHRGAVSMAEDLMADGSDRQVLKMANDLSAEQNTEIARLQRILEGDWPRSRPLPDDGLRIAQDPLGRGCITHRGGPGRAPDLPHLVSG